MIGAIYKQRVLNNNLLPYWRDGMEMRIYNGKFQMCFGWNTAQTPNLLKEHYRVSLDGQTVERLADIPFLARHTYLFFEEFGSLYAIGGNGPVDVLKYTETSSAPGTWVQVASDWNIDNFGREHFSRIYDPASGYAYILGGHKYAQPTQKMNFLYRSHKSTEFTVWEIVCALPAAMQNRDSGCLVIFKGAMYFFGGGDVSGGTPYPYNTKVFKSTDGGFTWTQIADLPTLFNSGIWGDAIATNDAIIYISGSDTNNSLTANNRTLITYDATNWYYMPLTVPGQHAKARCKDTNGNVYFAQGYSQNDLIKFKLVATQYNTF